MPTHHMIIRLVSLRKRELLNHAIDAMKLRKVDRFLTIECLAGRPAVDRGTFLDHGYGVDFDLTHCYQSQYSAWVKAKNVTYETKAPAFLQVPIHSQGHP